MKKVFTFLMISFFCASLLYAQDENDSIFVKDWKFPIGWWFPNQGVPAEGIDAYPRLQATATVVAEFDAQTADFDAEWAKIAGDGYVLGGEGKRLGLAASDKGAADFTGSFKTLTDGSNIYILLQYTDDDVTGNETVEVAWAPYLKINAPEVEGFPAAWYARYFQFGAYKATFKKTGFDAAMIVTGSGPNEDGSNGNINWGGTNDILSNNLFVDDKTAVGSKTVKHIITIGFACLTGEARPEFTAEIWKSLNDGKGISLDMKVNDVDADDALTGDPAAQKPAEYWWNSTNNDAYAVTWYAGFLAMGESLPTEGDAAYVKDWKFPIGWWFPNQPVPAEGIDNYPREVATAPQIANFDAQTADFDAEWAKIAGDGYKLGKPGSRLGLAASDKGDNDFKGSFKAFCDESNIYILLQYTDDDVTGNETVEVAWAPYLKIDVPEVEGFPAAWYARYFQFGAYKATFKNTGFDAAMIVTGSGPNSDGSNGNINWGGTNDILSNNLFLDDKTAVGAKTVKQIITIGFACLTGEARPEFNLDIWKALNEGKGISLDMKVNDVDADDALTGDPAAQKPAEYWWNSTNNDAYAVTWYAGFLAAGNALATSNDAEYVKDWKFPIGWWFPNQPVPAEGIENYPRKEASAARITNFDPQTANFDAEWAKIAGEGYKLGEPGSRLGLAASDKGDSDFKGAYKAFCDESNIYILLQFADDDVTGNETLEVAWAPYLKIDAPEVEGTPAAWYARYYQFGAYKATFKNTGFDAAMIVTGSGPNADGSNGNINWGGTNEILSNNLFLDNKTATGSKTVKWIVTIGFPALTGEARPEFNLDIWNALNDGKGISLDMKVNDVDADDALTGDPAAQKPAEYWWNSTNNDAYAVTWYAGFLKVGNPVGIQQIFTKESIFERVTPNEVLLNKTANVAVYNILGSKILEKKEVMRIDLSNLKTGVYIIRANNESLKVVH